MIQCLDSYHQLHPNDMEEVINCCEKKMWQLVWWMIYEM